MVFRTDMDETFNPDKYGMLVCPECNGNGKFPNDSGDVEVCAGCGGFGFIKKEEDPEKTNRWKVSVHKC
jgi:DnaJ-class molecular chaperone